MFCGILPWTWFSSSLLEASGSLIAGGNLIKKVLFPAEVLPIVSVLANMVHFFLGLPILIVFLVLYRHLPSAANLIWFPVAVLVQLLFTLALALLARGARCALPRHPRHPVEPADALVLRDADHLPVVHEPEVQSFRAFFNLNPFTHLAVSYQEVLFFNNGPVGHWKWLLALGAGSVVPVPRRFLALRSPARFVCGGGVTTSPVCHHELTEVAQIMKTRLYREMLRAVRGISMHL